VFSTLITTRVPDCVTIAGLHESTPLRLVVGHTAST